jgi:hypothetical protein
MELKKGDQVKVSPTATGLGVWVEGYIVDISECLGTKIFSIHYYKPDSLGNKGTAISNSSLIIPREDGRKN